MQPRVEEAPGTEWLERALAAVASAHTGIRPDAIQKRSLRDLAGHLLEKSSDLQIKLMHSDPELIEFIEEAAVTSETYFDRQPEHFDWLVSDFVPRTVSARQTLRVWSAGTASGEETYTLAARLRQIKPKSELFVLGSDLLPSNIAKARLGCYGPRSLRGALPPALGLERSPDGHLEVRDDLRAFTHFVLHNLLEAPPIDDRPFDVVLCRNVLVYFTDQARERALANLAASLAPAGVVLFGPADLPTPPRGLSPVGRSELQAFTQPRQASPISRTELGREPIRQRAETHKNDAVERHTQALGYVERGERRKAMAWLEELERAYPDYVPALFERALLHLRHGQHARARSLIQKTLALLDPIDPSSIIIGPEPLPAGFYSDMAHGLLRRK